MLDELDSLSPFTRPMFGCTSVYIDERIIFVLRSKTETDPDNGVWLATTHEHHPSLKKIFPSMRSLQLFGPGPTGWQILPSSAPDFEESVLQACALVRARDPRIGKIPKKKTLRSRKKR